LKMFFYKTIFYCIILLRILQECLSWVNTAVHFCWQQNLTYRCFKTVDKLIEVRINAA